MDEYLLDGNKLDKRKFVFFFGIFLFSKIETACFPSSWASIFLLDKSSSHVVGSEEYSWPFVSCVLTRSINNEDPRQSRTGAGQEYHYFVLHLSVARVVDRLLPYPLTPPRGPTGPRKQSCKADTT